MKHPWLPLLTTLLLLAGPGLASAQADSSAVESLRQTGKAFASVAQAVSPSVVFIQVEGSREASTANFGADDFLRRFFGDQFPQQPGPQRQPDNRVFGQGSGFVFAENDGKAYIMTNNHVVQNADRISVRFEDGREMTATVTGSDPQSDVAVIEVEADDLQPLPAASSADLQVGEWVVAIGSPFGLRSTLTVGVVSATGRTSIGINDYEDFIQTDAAINPGNSGGPLVNLDGHVVGMNTAIFSRSGGYMGIGFAIPIDLARGIANQLIDTGGVTRGFIGVSIQPLTQDLAEAFDIDRNDGIVVAQVTPDSPAQKAGVKEGDIIVGYQNKPVTDIGDFRNQVALTQPDSQANLEVLRDGQPRNLKVTIGSLNDSAALVAQGGGAAARELGIAVQTPTPEMAAQLGIEPGRGVVVTEVDPRSSAARNGFQPGTVILQVNQVPVNDAEAFYEAVENSPDNRAVLLVRSGNAQQYVVLNW